MNQSGPFPEWKGLQHLRNQCPLYPSTIPYAKSVCVLVLSMAGSLFFAITFTCSDKPSQVTSTTLNLKPVLSSRILSCVFLWVWNNSDWRIWKWRHRSNQLDQIKTWESRDGIRGFTRPSGNWLSTSGSPYDVLRHESLQREADTMFLGFQRHELNKSLLLTKYSVIFSYTKRSYNALHEYFLTITRIYHLFTSVSLSSPTKQMLTGLGDGSVGKALVMQAWGPDFNLQNPC